MTDQIKAYHLDWPPATVEGYQAQNQAAVLIFNFDVTTAAKADATIQYVVGRAVWCYQNLPPGTKFTLSFDFRGQGIVASATEKFKERINNLLKSKGIADSFSTKFLI